MNIKNWFLKPKRDYKKWGFAMIMCLWIASPTMLLWVTMIEMGIYAPNMDINYLAYEVSTQVADNLVGPIITLFELGQKYGIQNKGIALFAITGIKYIIYGFWLACAGSILQMIRIAIGDIIRFHEKKSKK